MDREKSRAFTQRMMRLYGDALLNDLLVVGKRSGLLDAAAEGPGTPGEIAERAGLNERYVREWLRAMATGGIVEHDDGLFTLPPEHAISLTGDSFLNTTAIGEMATAAGATIDHVVQRFRTGAGTPFHHQPGDAPDTMGRLSRARYRTFLVDDYLGQIDGLPQRLAAGAQVADVGCGTGQVPILIARAHPACHVVGLDASPPSIEMARAEADAEEVDNVEFVVGTIGELSGPRDLITAFDVIHDLGDPARAVSHIRRCLVEDGLFVMCDSAAPSSLDAQAQLPWAPMMYGLSVLTCVPTARSQGGEGLGNMWGREAALSLLDDAGFSNVTDLPVKGDPMNALYVARP